MKFRNLTPEDIEVRVQSVSKTGSGVVLLLYKNARVDMAILDDTVRPMNWQREHYECKGNLFCRVGINVGALTDREDLWVWKSDCGVESNTEAQKGEASDSFKRACFNWGIGRELYTAPFIFIPASKCHITESKRCFDELTVEKIKTVGKRIVGLSILNNSLKTEDIRQKRVFVWTAQKGGEENG